jgi:16S rRNA (guanine527-N7)-methyltransferase
MPRAHAQDDGRAVHADSTILARERAEVLAEFDVSRETAARLDRFVAVLLSWQNKANLIGRSTISSLWRRHIGDSLQLLPLAETSSRVWVDLGSGAGFPGLAIGCALAEREGARVHLIESNAKKAAFLREACRETAAPVVVHAARIEGIEPNLMPDIITARALAPLDQLLRLAAPMLTKGAQGLFLKGQDIEKELTQATKHWNIDADIVPSRTSTTGRILRVRGLSPR